MTDQEKQILAHRLRRLLNSLKRRRPDDSLGSSRKRTIEQHGRALAETLARVMGD